MSSKSLLDLTTGYSDGTIEVHYDGSPQWNIDIHPQICVASFSDIYEYSTSCIVSIPSLHTKKANQTLLIFLVPLNYPARLSK